MCGTISAMSRDSGQTGGLNTLHPLHARLPLWQDDRGPLDIKQGGQRAQRGPCSPGGSARSDSEQVTGLFGQTLLQGIIHSHML